jgi:hypothetical protein
MTIKESNVTINVKDLDNSILFYESIGFTIDDFDSAKSMLEKLAISTTNRQEEGGEFILFNDPDGTSLYFIKPK